MTRFTASLLADMSAATVAEQLAQTGVPLDSEVVEVRCRQLVRWGNLIPSLRDAKVSTVADYLRARSRYQVSSLGGRVHRDAIEIMQATDGRPQRVRAWRCHVPECHTVSRMAPVAVPSSEVGLISAAYRSAECRMSPADAEISPPCRTCQWWGGCRRGSRC
ncbi:DUF2397 family protein [Nocardia terpenica]